MAVNTLALATAGRIPRQVLGLAVLGRIYVPAVAGVTPRPGGGRLEGDIPDFLAQARREDDELVLIIMELINRI